MTDLSRLDSLLGLIDERKGSTAAAAPSTSSSSSSSSSSALSLPPSCTHDWVKFYDGASQKWYYYNRGTHLTTWTKPDDIDESTIPSGSGVIVTQTNAIPTSSIMQINMPDPAAAMLEAQASLMAGNERYQRDLRQMGAYFNVSELDVNREQARVKREELKHSKIDWKQYKSVQRKKKLKKKIEQLYGNI